MDEPDSSIRRYVSHLVFRPDGQQIAAVISQARNDGPKRLVAWDATSGQLSFSAPISAGSATTPHYSIDGAQLIVAETVDQSQGSAVFYDAVTGERQRLISLPSAPRTHFINIQHEIFAADARSDLVLWDLMTGQERLRLPGYSGGSAYAISPDGTRIVIGKGPFTGQSELSLWSLKSGRRLLAFNREGYVSAISFSPDGNRLVAAFMYFGVPGKLKPIQIWDATPLPEEIAK